jgi:2-polyprenyl-6-methoxyphenol hydroxylase-like FAD-dependent oxidoreductase
MAVETLAGKELAWFIANVNEGIRDVSPTLRLFITQKLLEPLLQQRATGLGAGLRFSTEMTSFEQDASGVTAQIRDRDTGVTQTVRAKYMIAADGARSKVRDQLGLRLEGTGIFSHSITIYFRAPVTGLLRGRNLSVIYVNHPQLRGFIRIEKPYDSGFLVVNTTGDPAKPNTNLWDLTNQECEALVRAALGDDTIPIAIDDVMKWHGRADNANHYQSGRVFLAGDAAHSLTPYGGFNGNCGVQDAHNLAWKLAMVLRGHAAPSLLDTYETERRPVGMFTAEQAYVRYTTREAKYLVTPDLPPAQNDLHIELGYLYRSSAILAEADFPAVLHEHPRESRGRPGARAAHVWLDAAQKQSTLDLFGRNVVLLAGPDGATWKPAIANCPVPVDFHQHDIAGAYGIASDGAVLVRPDGFVAWRAKTAQPASAATSALKAVLGLV